MASLARTILEEHLERGELVPGQEIALRVDQALAQDATGTMAMMQFERFGEERVRVDTAMAYVDHNILQIDFKNPDDHRFLQAMAAKYGAWFSRPGNGICHYVHCERFATPWQTLIGADSHTTQSGSCAMIAIGAGGLDVAVCMAGHPFELPCPKIVGVFLENELARPWIQAKDVILELLRRRGVRGGRGCVFEFTGPGVHTLSYTERGTIANMIAELGATGAVFPADDETRAWLEEQERLEDFTELPTGDTGDFDDEEQIDLAELVPLVAKPSSPGNVVPVDELVGTPIQQVCIGSPAIAAVSMLKGVISDPRELDPPELPERPAARPEVVQKHILEPVPEEEAVSIQIPRGPNIFPPPEQKPLPNVLAGRVLIVAPDDISTGDLSPDGATVMAYRSNVPAIAEFTFQHRDKGFAKRAHEWGGGFIVAGHNYGQGSSREHAALAPAQLGVRAVIAKSFARIHRRNLIAQGIVPLLFKDEADYDRAELGQKWEIRDLHAIAEGEDELQVEIDGGGTFTVTHDFLPREREIVVAGGLIRHLTAQQPAGV